MKPEVPRLVLVTYKLAADVTSKVVTLVVFIVAARRLSADEFGVLAVAMTTGWLLAVASDAGLPLDLARTVARGNGKNGLSPVVVSDSLRWRVRLGTLAAVLGAVIGAWLAPPPLLAAFALIVGAQIVSATLDTLSHAFRGVGRSEIEASVTLAQRLVTGVAACSVLVLWPSLVWLAIALVIPPAIALGISWRIARRMTVSRGRSPAGADAPLRHRFLHDVAPIGLGIFLSALYFRCDVYFVERWHGLETVGIYNAAFRSVEALRLFPAAVLAVVFPTLCTARTLAPLKTTAGWLLVAAIVPAAALAFAPAPILVAVYGAPFVAAAPALQRLAWAVPLFFVNYALTHQVLAWDGQRAYVAVVTAALATSLGANLLLVPSGGMRGAATATLLTEIVVTAGCLVTLAVKAGQTSDEHVPRSTPVEPSGAYAASLPGDST